MIGYIKGKLLSSNDGTVILENNGIGYEITCSASVYTKILENKGGEVYTYMAVREDGIFLYGFESTEEKNMFLKLISVSGVGPKAGIAILSTMNINDLALKIATNDVKGLCIVKGLGKKTAERIILELREKVGDVKTDGKEAQQSAPQVALDSEDEDVIIALMSLGFTRAESLKALSKAKDAGIVGVEKVFAFALKNIK